jgi:hypothetical protein
MSHAPVRLIAVANATIVFLLVSLSEIYGTIFGKYHFVREFMRNHERTSPASSQERYMIDHIAKVIPAGVTEVENIFEISAWLIPPIRYWEPGILTSEVNPIVIIATMRRRYFITRYC